MKYSHTLSILLLASFASIAMAATGSVELQIHSGLSLIGSPFDLEDPRVAAIFSEPPDGLEVFKLNPETKEWAVSQFRLGAWTNPDQELLAGEAVWVRNPSIAFKIVLTGKIPESRAISIRPGDNLLTLLPWEDLPPWDRPDVQLHPLPGDQLFTYSPASGTMRAYVYSFGAWTPSAPVLAQGEGFLYRRSEPLPAAACTGGLIYFSNYVPAFGDKRIFIDCVQAAGPEFKAQLCVYSDGQCIFLSEPVPFTTLPDGSGSGYVTPTVVCLPFIDPLSIVTLSMRVWTGAEVFEAALFRGETALFDEVARPQDIPPRPLTELPVWPPPRPVIHAENTAVLAGESIQLTLLNGGAPNQWQKLVGETWENIPGATGAGLHIASATESDAGTYRALQGICPSNELEIDVLPEEPDGPALAAAQIEGGIQLSWPVALAGFVLQEKSSVSDDWVDSSATITVVGNHNVVTIPTTAEARFFCLVLVE